jgi:hypothetical protein
MTVSARVLYAAVLRMGSVVEAIVDETAAVALEIYQEGKKERNHFERWRRKTDGMAWTRTARATSLSSIVLSASETASPTLTPPFLSSSAAARNRGFSLMLEVSYMTGRHHPPSQHFW